MRLPALTASVGVSAATMLLVQGMLGRPLLCVATACAGGLLSVAAVTGLVGRRPVGLVAGIVAPLVAALLTGWLLVVPVVPVVVIVHAIAFAAGWALVRGHRRVALGGAVALPLVTSAAMVAGAGAWSVDDPTSASAGEHGIVVSRDTHAFLVQQGAAILAADGHADIAAFLATPDPKAPTRADGTREPYLWRIQTGARDADRVLKSKEMPDHFFNWWTHSGKGLIAGTSAATWAEQQFAKATKAWQAGDRSEAMYRLGAAVHLVDDACAPPHASPYVPDHRVYEEWVLAQQQRYAVTSGGIYQSDFRVKSGHGGERWSSSHTRGWLDECAHRAAELTINTAQPPPDNPSDPTPYTSTMAHFGDAQRLTAGYLTFFFDSVGGPR